MNAEITLSLDERVIAQAMRYSEISGTNLSKLVEDFLAGIGKEETSHPSIIDRLSELVSSNIKIPVPDDYREFIRESRYRDMLDKMASSDEA